MSARRVMILSLLVALALFPVVIGCTEGDVVQVQIPLVPCERPPDGDWRQHRPLWGRQRPLDAVWARADLAVVVGAGGLAMVWEGEDWRLEDPGTSLTLNAVAGHADGEICAVGTGGVVARRLATGWQAAEVAGAGDLWRVQSSGASFWACGEAGSLVRIDASGPEAVAPPHTGDLLDVVALADSLWVLDGTDTLRVAVAGDWQDVAPPRLAGKALRSLAPLPDGRLVVLADSLYVRDATGWWRPEQMGWPGWSGRGTHLRLVGGELWYMGRETNCETGQYVLAEHGWEVRTTCESILAPLTGGTVLGLHDDRLSWYEDFYSGDPDPISSVPVSMVGFLDGSRYALSSDFWLETVDETGVRVAAPEPDAIYFSIRILVGASLADYYGVSHGGDIWRVRDNVAEEIARDVTEERVENAALFANGDLILFTRDAEILRWREGAIDTLAAGDGYILRAAGPTQAIATAAGTDDIYIVDSEGITPTGLDRGYRAAGFLPDGRPVVLAEQPRVDGQVLGSGWWTFVWDAAGESMAWERAAISLECPDLGLVRGATGDDGFYVWSTSASMVFRLAGDPAWHDWELVAGPLDDEISELAVQPDGSLIAEGEGLYWHPGEPLSATSLAGGFR